MRVCPDALRADLLRFYGLTSIHRLGITATADLTANLPDGAATWRRLDDARAWTPEAHLMAMQLDLLQQVAYGLSKGKGRKPKPIPRPGMRHEREGNGRNDIQGVTDKRELLEKLSRASITI